MPLAFEEIKIENQFSAYSSVLFVACQICPRLHVAFKTKTPYATPWYCGIQKNPFAKYIRNLRNSLEEKKIWTGLFPTSISSPICLWPDQTRKAFNFSANGYQAIALIACDAALYSIRDHKNTRPAICLMRVTGIANYTLKKKFPLRIFPVSLTIQSFNNLNTQDVVLEQKRSSGTPG